jgi:hypothetical protein
MLKINQTKWQLLGCCGKKEDKSRMGKTILGTLVSSLSTSEHFGTQGLTHLAHKHIHMCPHIQSTALISISQTGPSAEQTSG